LLKRPLTVLVINQRWQAAEKLFSEGVILSEAKDLLFARAENKAGSRNTGATSE
jgi:hypothetical protein